MYCFVMNKAVLYTNLCKCLKCLSLEYVRLHLDAEEINRSIMTQPFLKVHSTELILSFWTDRSGQTVQTQIRLLLE